MNVIGVCASQGARTPAVTAFSSPHTATLSSSCRRLCSPCQQPSYFLHRGSLVTDSSFNAKARRETTVVCGIGDFWGGDLLGFDLNKWCKDVEEYGAIAVYTPHEGGYEGRYACRLKEAGYHFMNFSARSMGDPETYLTKVHEVRPAHLGKQAITCFYEPPEVDYRLSRLPPNCKGLVLWIIEAQVLSKVELQYLALLPAFRPKVKVIAECGTWRKYRWKPLREVAGLPLTQSVEAVEEPKPQSVEAVEVPRETQNVEVVEEPTAAATELQTEEKKSPARVV